MKLSISNNGVYGIRTDGKLQHLPHLAIETCATAGFDRMEYNFCSGPAAAKPLAGDNWKDVVAGLKQTLDANNICVPYTHDFWYLMANTKGPEDVALKDLMIRRSVEATTMLESKLMVIHTQSIFDAEGYNPEKTHIYNKVFLSEMGELAAKAGLALAIENVFPIPGAIGHACYPEEMAELMQELNDPLFGICWDFGHANMAQVDHEQALEIIAPWLRHIHVNDNKAKTDEHTIPGYGTVPWDKVMKKLKAVGYQGDLTLTVRTFAQTALPHRWVDDLRYLHSVGSDLIRMFEEA